jgi:hypothetical protein
MEQHWPQPACSFNYNSMDPPRLLKMLIMEETRIMSSSPNQAIIIIIITINLPN